jgi:hypothetical protein
MRHGMRACSGALPGDTGAADTGAVDTGVDDTGTRDTRAGRTAVLA